MIPVGAKNYLQGLREPIILSAICYTAVYFVAVFTVQVVGGVLFAAAMHSKIFLANMYKIIIVIPVVVAPATLAPAHIQVWQTDGTFNHILEGLGLGFFTQGWIGQSTTSLLVVTLVG